MNNTDKILFNTAIIPVIQIEDESRAVPMAEALVRGGILAAEITFRTEAAAKSIANITKQVPDFFTCAGTVRTLEQAKIAVDSGAKAIISPGTNAEIINWCIKQAISVYPGCATPTEIEIATSLGLNTLKLFPAEVVGGVSMLKALYGPYSTVKFMPTGGINMRNVLSYLSLPNVIACGGSWICSVTSLQNEDYSTIEQNAREARKVITTTRSNPTI